MLALLSKAIANQPQSNYRKIIIISWRILKLICRVDDIKFRIGEGARHLQMSARHQIEKFESDSQKIIIAEPEALKLKSQFYKTLRISKIDKKNEELSEKTSARSESMNKYKIITNTKFLNESKSHKVIKNSGRLYVL